MKNEFHVDKAPAEKKLVVVYIPAHNEEKTLEKMAKKIRELYADPDGYYVKIIVVNDGSKDRTAEIAAGLKKKGIIDHVVHHMVNQGLGAAVRSGLWKSYEMGADIAVKIDADYQHIPEDIELVVRPILEDRTDVCFGSRMMGKITYKMPLYRKIGNAFFSATTQFFTDLKVTDGQTGLIATNKRYLERFRLTSDWNETQQMIIDAWRNQLRFIEVPVTFNKREHGKSFINLRYPLHVFPNIVRLFIHSCPLKIFLPIGAMLVLLSMFLGYLFLTGRTFIFGDTSIVLFFLSGVQIILFGFIADIISKKRLV